MIIYRGFNDTKLKRCPRAVAVGVFDGVHRGHATILARAVRRARRAGWRSMVVTFDPDPSRVLRPAAKHPILISLAHRLHFFEKAGLDEALVVPFDRRFSRVSHGSFLGEYLLKRLDMRSLAVGYDFRFGSMGKGDGAFLKAASERSGFELTILPALRSGSAPISSTRIRELIESGRLAAAARLLGRSVSVYGDVVRGKGRGGKLGFPTANLNPHHETLPPEGVYAAYGHLKGRRLRAVVHIGPRPTFGEKDRSLEAHFLGYSGDLYGQEIELVFVKRLRATRRFGDPDELRRAIQDDIAAARRALRTVR